MAHRPATPLKVIGQIGLWRLLGLCLLLLFSKQSAYADIWGFIDARGVAHFAAERVDERYGIFSRSGEPFDAHTDTRSPAEPTRVPEAPAAPTAAATRVMAYFDNAKPYQALKPHLRDASQTHHIDYALLQALIATESGFDAEAVSPKGAIGLMQIMPGTAARYGVASDKHMRLERKLFDPGTNIRVGSRYLRDLLNKFPGQLELVLAAYNAGEGAVQRAGNKIPNYKETQNYVKTVLQLYALLKPSAVVAGTVTNTVAEKQSPPTRIRMTLPGGAANRSNMISSVQPLNLSPHFTSETP